MITPEVTIHNEKPSQDTGRIEVYPNKTVAVEALMGESVIFICNIFNMIPNARVRALMSALLRILGYLA